MKLSHGNIEVITDDGYFRVIIKYDTHVLHSEKLNLATAIKLRDKLLE